MELGVLQTIAIILRAGNGVHRPTIVDESYSSHDKEKEQCPSLCIVLNFGVTSKSTVVANSFVVLHAWALYLSTVGGHDDAFAIWNLEYYKVAIRSGKL